MGTALETAGMHRPLIRPVDTSYPKCMIPRYPRPCHSEHSHILRPSGARPA